MKIYFGFTVAGDRSGVETARNIIALLEAMGHQVLTRHLVQDNAWELDRTLGPEAVYQRDMRWLAECDLLIAEVSGSSFGVGYEVGYLLARGTKRAILFYRTEAANRISLLIRGNTHPHCTVVPYSEGCEVEEFLRADREICPPLSVGE
jgi:nucleoside 2-deoxyribosyltransferase